MKRILLGATILAALSVPAMARLQLSIGVGAATFSCFDGQLGCDQSGGANNLLVVNTTVGGAFVEIALAQSQFGKPDILQLSSSSIVNTLAIPITVKLVASDTGFTPPIHAIRESGSLTFNDAVGSGPSFLQFWADAANTQGANPANTPGTLLDTVSGAPTTNPDSFSGSRTSLFDALAPFSMTEAAALTLRGDASITGFNQAMQSEPIPEPRTWVLMGLGFALMAGLGWRRRGARIAF